jgi:carbamoyl-phosphate synthase large subunit
LGAILISSSSAKVPLVRAVRTASQKLRRPLQVIAGDADPNVVTRYVADSFWNMPVATDDQLPAILQGCRDRGITVVMPTRDGELPFWTRHQERLGEAGIGVIVSPPPTIEVCLDKLAFAEFGISRNFPFIPACQDPGSVVADRLVVKERYGAGARRIGLNLDRKAALVHAKALQNPIFQPFIKGIEISIDAWLDWKHSVKGLVLRRREVIAHGESSITATFRNSDVELLAVSVLQALGLRGPVVMQAVIDSAGQLNILECNPRFGGASTAGIAAGLDPFYWSLVEASGEDVTLYPFHRIEGEVRQVRVPSDIHLYGAGV